LLALYTLNFSIDSRDAFPDGVAEDLAINDIESLYEFVLEGLAGIDNAVEEHEEHDQDGESAFNAKKIYLPTYSLWEEYSADTFECTPENLFLTVHFYAVTLEITAPPPRC